MGRSMPRQLFPCWVALFLVATPAFSYDRADAVLVLTDDGALDAPTVHAIRNVAVSGRPNQGMAFAHVRRRAGAGRGNDKRGMLFPTPGPRRFSALGAGGR